MTDNKRLKCLTPNLIPINVDLTIPRYYFLMKKLAILLNEAIPLFLLLCLRLGRQSSCNDILATVVSSSTNGSCQTKTYLRKCANLDHSAHAQSIIRARVLHSYILQYPTMLLAVSEGPDQTARTRVDLGLRCPHMPVHVTRPKHVCNNGNPDQHA